MFFEWPSETRGWRHVVLLHFEIIARARGVCRNGLCGQDPSRWLATSKQFFKLNSESPIASLTPGKRWLNIWTLTQSCERHISASYSYTQLLHRTCFSVIYIIGKVCTYLLSHYSIPLSDTLYTIRIPCMCFNVVITIPCDTNQIKLNFKK
jgi:hypothetical protein